MSQLNICGVGMWARGRAKLRYFWGVKANNIGNILALNAPGYGRGGHKCLIMLTTHTGASPAEEGVVLLHTQPHLQGRQFRQEAVYLTTNESRQVHQEGAVLHRKYVTGWLLLTLFHGQGDNWQLLLRRSSGLQLPCLCCVAWQC